MILNNHLPTALEHNCKIPSWNIMLNQKEQSIMRIRPILPHPSTVESNLNDPALLPVPNRISKSIAACKTCRDRKAKVREATRASLVGSAPEILLTISLKCFLLCLERSFHDRIMSVPRTGTKIKQLNTSPLFTLKH
jgi:hypothetical protein